ncbi:MAG TPA: hypothetical protein VGR47_07460 [Terracidiphilus sp.]|nr:hypothetical protein [Terracidiphilus sp.]
MKPIFTTIAIATLVVIASLTQAQAQSPSARVKVPFAFDCGMAHFAAGTYAIAVDKDVLILSGSTQRAMTLVKWRTDSNTDQPGYLTFRQYGNRYFLAQFHANDGVTVDLGASAKERNLIREQVSNPKDSGTVRLALNDSALGRSR